MRKVAYYFLWAFVAAIPLQQLAAEVLVNAAGTLTRLIGIAAAIVGITALLQEGRLRPFSRTLGYLAIFMAWSGLSFIWSASQPDTVGRLITYTQLIIMLVLIMQFAQTEREQKGFIQAYVFGCIITLIDLYQQYRSGVTFAEEYLGGVANRFTAFNNNPNELALGISLGIPFAWYLVVRPLKMRMTTANRALLAMNFSFIGAAVFGVLITGSRGGLLSVATAMLMIPFTIPVIKGAKKVVVVVAMVCATMVSLYFVPESAWNRLLTLQEVFDPTQVRNYGVKEGANVRVVIWRQGLITFMDNPQVAVLGVGSGAYAEGVEPLYGQRFVAHNVFVSVLVEVGLIGALFFLLVLYFTMRTTLLYMKGAERLCWLFTFMTWMVGCMFMTWEYRKETWFLFGMVAAREVLLEREWAKTRKKKRKGLWVPEHMRLRAASSMR